MSWESDTHIQQAGAAVRNERWRDAPTGIKLIAGFYALKLFFGIALMVKLTGLNHPLAGDFLLLSGVLNVIALVCLFGLLSVKLWGHFGILVITVIDGLLYLVSFDLIGVAIHLLILHVLFKHAHYYLDT